MKTIFATVLLIVSSFLGKVSTDEVTAVYDGPSDGVYYFTTDDMSSYGFDTIEESAAKKFDLNDDTYVGETFIVTYRTETRTDEEELDYDVYIITDLELSE